MKKSFIFIMVVALLVTLFGGFAAAADKSVLDKVLESGKITIAVFTDVPPLGFTDEKNELTGIDVDVAKGVVEALGVEVDLVVAGFSINPERRKVVEFTDQYFKGGVTLVTSSSNPKISDVKNIADLSGIKIAVSKGSYNDEIATKLAGSTNEIIRFDNVSDVYQALRGGKADAIVEDNVLAGYTIKNQYPELRPVGDLLDVYSTGMGVRRGDQIWLNWLNGYIFDLCSSGKMAEICAKYGVEYYLVNYEY